MLKRWLLVFFVRPEAAQHQVEGTHLHPSLTEALRKRTARAVVEAIFSGFVRMQRDRDKGRGCLVVSGALASGEEAETVRRELAQLRQAIVTALRERFERAVRGGDLPAGTDCAALARYTPTPLNGLAVQSARGGPAQACRPVAAPPHEPGPPLPTPPPSRRAAAAAGGRLTPPPA